MLCQLLSLQSGQFPDAWKEAQVVPILKKGSASDKQNYRPVSLLSVVSKVLEMIIHEQLAEYFEKNKLLPPEQHGFRRKRSTTSALLSICGRISSLRRQNHQVTMASYDLSAAFDCIDAEILDKKLEHYGIDLQSRNWIASFLSNRRQFVKIGTSRSSTVQLSVGSPQGSILSPLLFIIYLADMNYWISDGATFSYADDTAAITFGQSKKEALYKLEVTSNELLVFFASNMLVANASKTSLLVFRSPRSVDARDHSLNIGGASVYESDSITLLGVTVSADLSWTAQYDAIKSSLRSTNGLLSRLSNFMPNRFLIPLIHGLQLSKVRYALPLFCDIRTSENDPASSNMQRIQIELNKGLRRVLGTTLADRCPVRDMVKEIGVPTANQLAIETTLMDVWRHINHDLPAVDQLVLVDEYVTGNKMTRRTGKGLLALPPLDESGSAKFVQQGTRLWNMAPQQLREEKIEERAKRLVREFSRSMPL